MKEMKENIPLFIQSCLAGNGSNWEHVRAIALKFLRRQSSSQTED